jgi:hypothetical protein
MKRKRKTAELGAQPNPAANETKTPTKCGDRLGDELSTVKPNSIPIPVFYDWHSGFGYWIQSDKGQWEKVGVRKLSRLLRHFGIGTQKDTRGLSELDLVLLDIQTRWGIHQLPAEIRNAEIASRLAPGFADVAFAFGRWWKHKAGEWSEVRKREVRYYLKHKRGISPRADLDRLMRNLKKGAGHAS